MADYNPKDDKPIVLDIGTHYKLEGDDFWYERNFGGPDIPMINIGPGPNPDMTPIGPGCLMEPDIPRITIDDIDFEAGDVEGQIERLIEERRDRRRGNL